MALAIHDGLRPSAASASATQRITKTEKKRREQSDWWRKMYDLPHSLGKCWQGLRSVNDGVLVWEDAIDIDPSFSTFLPVNVNNVGRLNQTVGHLSSTV